MSKLRFTPKQAATTAVLLRDYGEAGKGVSVTRGENRDVVVEADSGEKYVVGGRGRDRRVN